MSDFIKEIKGGIKDFAEKFVLGVDDNYMTKEQKLRVAELASRALTGFYKETERGLEEASQDPILLLPYMATLKKLSQENAERLDRVLKSPVFMALAAKVDEEVHG